MAALAQPDLQEAAAIEAVRAVPTPKGVHFRRVRFDTDFSDGPAIHVVFSVSKEYRLGKAGGRKLGDLVLAVLAVLWRVQSSRIPYVTFEDER